jgi:hypothetical protein
VGDKRSWSLTLALTIDPRAQGENAELSKAQLKKRMQKEEKERKKAEKAAIEAEKRSAKQQAALDVSYSSHSGTRS